MPPRRFPSASLALAAALALAPRLAAHSAAPATAEPTRYGIEDFLTTTSYFGASFSPDGRHVLVSSDATGVYNAYAVPAGGGDPVPRTRSTDDAVFAVSYFPADERILFSRDRGGDENAHLFVQAPDGSVRDLTPGEKTKASFVRWSGDRRSFFVLSNARDSRCFDLYRYSVDGYASERIYQNDACQLVSDVSPDGRYLALTQARSTSDSDVLLHDLRGGRTEDLTPHTGREQHGVADFSPDGRTLLLTSDAGAEFSYLERYDLASGERSPVLKPEWDVMYAYYSPRGRYLLVGTNEDARTRIQLLDASTLRPVALPAMPPGNPDGVRFSADESRLAFYLSGERQPRDLYVGDLAAAPRRLTRSLNPRIDADQLVDGKVVRFRTAGGVEIPGILYRPREASGEHRVPAVVWVHGGPGGQSRLGWNPEIQFLVNHGYAVYAINNRGSSGYGKTFFGRDDRRHGEADLDDVVASKQMLTGTGWVDPERIGIVGGSYGGYMTLAALTFRPGEFRAGVDLFGPANWVRTLESIPPDWAAFREALYAEMGDPATDGERLRRISPLFHAEQIRRPLMVLQGANDPRVLQRESDEIVAAVRKNGVPVEYLVFPDEGHGFVKRANNVRGWQAVLEFLDAHLKGS